MCIYIESGFAYNLKMKEEKMDRFFLSNRKLFTQSSYYRNWLIKDSLFATYNHITDLLAAKHSVIVSIQPPFPLVNYDAITRCFLYGSDHFVLTPCTG